MKHVLLDTNIPLNMMLDSAKRAMPLESTLVMNALVKGEFVAYITPTTFSNMFYAVRKERGQAEASRIMREMLDIIRIIDQDESVFRNALVSGWPDVEDAPILRSKAHGWYYTPVYHQWQALQEGHRHKGCGPCPTACLAVMVATMGGPGHHGPVA